MSARLVKLLTLNDIFCCSRLISPHILLRPTDASIDPRLPLLGVAELRRLAIPGYIASSGRDRQ